MAVARTRQLGLFGDRDIKPEDSPALVVDETAGLVHGHPQGALSEWSGGYLNAVEAIRVVRGQSIRVLGAAFADGRALCRACLDAELEKRPGYPASMDGSGPMVHVYPGGKGQKQRTCAGCGAAFSGVVHP